MSLPQFLFFCVFALVAVAIMAFGWYVVRAARVDDGGEYPSRRLLARLARPGADRAELQRWAFYLHRISGVGLFMFLVMHVGDVSLYAISRELYDEVHQVYGTTPMRVVEVLLLFGLLFHALNGLRLIVVDIADLGLRAATRGLYLVAGLTLVAGSAGGAVIMWPVFG
ncbi:succinate dehydrogenase subunit C [Tamaricihabitans halophyticus]|uniref:Succinate dehydrogenase subunit C n=1 Tax=Tamaricihabitans halophyticus TaxID=1262583 RepID=A0A4R2Q9J5_9PSEU|nr:succinate dehydrogenase, cytochrome b556 subunit [Tamaricihabitans halophyticus]TCP44718.1 succinate dehydrogenase subunit C [Tamaricihabitans halophyticus]